MANQVPDFAAQKVRILSNESRRAVKRGLAPFKRLLFLSITCHTFVLLYVSGVSYEGKNKNKNNGERMNTANSVL